MLFRRILRSFKKDEIPLYFSLQDSAGFLEMLIQLRAELLTANLSVENLSSSSTKSSVSKFNSSSEKNKNEIMVDLKGAVAKPNVYQIS